MNKMKLYFGEQNTEEWQQLRLGRFTASEIYRLFVEPRTKKAKESGEWSSTAWKYITEKARDIIYQEPEEEVYSESLSWGKENEPIASQYFQESTLNFVDEEKISFVEFGEFCGMSPDDTIDHKTPSEYKCPKQRLVHLNHLLIKNEIDLFNFDKQKYYQVHFQIWCLGAEFGYWSSFDPRMLNNEETAHKAIHTIEVQRNEELCEQFYLKTQKAGQDRNEFIEKILQ